MGGGGIGGGDKGGEGGGSLMMYARDLWSSFRFSIGFLLNTKCCLLPEIIVLIQVDIVNTKTFKKKKKENQ